MYCKHCKEYVSSDSTTHYCKEKRGLLSVDEDDSFLVSTIIGAATDSWLAGGLLGGDLLGGAFGDLLGGDDDSWF